MERFLTEFEVPQKVIISSKWLRVPEIMLDASLVFVFIFYSFLYNLGFATVLDTSADVYLNSVHVQKGKWCWDVSGLCEYTLPEFTKYDYCTQHGDREAELLSPESQVKENASGLIWKCVNPRERSVSFSRSNGGVAIGTSLAFRNGTQAYIAAAEHLHLLKMLARVTDRSGNLRLNLFQTPGAFKFIGEEQPRSFANDSRPSYSGWTSNKECGVNGENFFSVGQKRCETSCWGNYMTLNMLLQAANLSLSDKSAFGSVRQFGVQLHLDIHFTNADDFWSLPFGWKPRYTMQVSRARYTDGGASPEETYRAFWTDDDNSTPQEVLVRGVFVKPRVSSHILAFEPFAAVSSLTLATVILGFAKMFVSKVLTLLYKRLKGLEHISILHEVAASEKSMADYEVKKLLTKSGNSLQRGEMFEQNVGLE